MYLHLGNDFLVNIKEIIGIFDIEKSSTSKLTKDFLSKSGKANRIYNVTYEMPKSFVVCLDDDLNETVYISQISCRTLEKRMKKIFDLK